MKRVSRDGTRYSLLGADGPGVVMIHGLGINSAMWDTHAALLSDSYRVLTYDLYGHGGSRPPGVTPSLSELSGQLLRLLDELSLDKVALVGFSLGGMIARRFAMDHPERVWAMALVGTAYSRDDTARAAVQMRVDQARREGPSSTIEAALVRWFSDGFRQRRPDVLDTVRRWVLANDPLVYPTIYQVLVDGVDELVAPDPPISCPTLVTTGEEDYGNSPAMARAIAAEIPGARVVILDGLRHMAPTESPELFGALLAEFLEEARTGRNGRQTQ